MSPKGTDKTNKSPARKFVNVIYFVDSSKTRSFKLSTPLVWTLATIITVVSVWSVYSVFFVLNLKDQQNTLVTKLFRSKETIFEYQTKYDNVYKIAYPRIESDGDDNRSITLRLPSFEAVARKTNGELEREADSTEIWPINIEDLSLIQLEVGYDIRFAIKNTISPKRSEGYIWTILDITDSQGKRVYIGSPSGLKLDEQGRALNPSDASSWYSIKYYKTKKFQFRDIQTNLNLNNVIVGMMDLEGARKLYRFPISKVKIKEASLGTEQVQR